MKKLITVTLATIIALATMPTQSFAFQANELQISDGRFSVNSELQQTIDSYFDIREDVLQPQTRTNFSASNEMNSISNNTLVNDKEVSRLSAVDNLSKYHNVHVISSENSTKIEQATKINLSDYEVEVYEWTWIEYNDGKGGATDRMGYGTDHTVKLSKQSDNSFLIVANDYDESDILGVPAKEFSEKNTVPLPLVVDNQIALASNGVNSNRTLDVNSLIDYADEWVGQMYAPSGDLMHPENYNLDEYGKYSADCAGYVSQCLEAGGMVYDYDDGKDWNDWNGSQWWFDTTEMPSNPATSNNNDLTSPPSWRYVPLTVDYWTNEGYSHVSASASNVYPGSLVFTSNQGHVAICVGYNHQGIPIVNGHNRDVYHVPYTVGVGRNSTTIQIATDNQMVYTPENAWSVTPTSTQQKSYRDFSTGANHYYKFTVTQSGYYTFEGANTSERIDTKGTLYARNCL